jgi:hypothetical protein
VIALVAPKPRHNESGIFAGGKVGYRAIKKASLPDKISGRDASVVVVADVVLVLCVLGFQYPDFANDINCGKYKGVSESCGHG